MLLPRSRRISSSLSNTRLASTVPSSPVAAMSGGVWKGSTIRARDWLAWNTSTTTAIRRMPAAVAPTPFRNRVKYSFQDLSFRCSISCSSFSVCLARSASAMGSPEASAFVAAL